MDDEKTTAIGLFHYAHSYAASAHALRKIELHVTHQDAPIRFQFSHAIELYLKAFLRLKGHSVKELSTRPYSHNTKALMEKAEEYGLYLLLPHAHTVDFVSNDTADRYIVTGVRKVIPLDIMDGTCQELHDLIGSEIYEAEGLTRPPIKY